MVRYDVYLGLSGIDGDEGDRRYHESCQRNQTLKKNKKGEGRRGREKERGRGRGMTI